MITLSKSGNSVTFTFENNGHYLMNGTIDVPVNGLILVTDESEMASFLKIDGDPFISCLYSDLGMTKAELISWYEENMVGSTGISEEEVEAMISSATTDFFDGVEYDSDDKAIYFYNGETIKATIDASDFVIDGMVDNVEIQTISGASYLVIEFNTAAGKEDIQIPVTSFFDAEMYYTKAEVDSALSGKADTSAVTASISAAVSGLAESSAVTEEISEAVSGKADTSAVTEEISAAVSGLAQSSAVTAINSSLTAHTANTDIHTTSAEKAAWNGKLDASAYTPTDLSAYYTSAQTNAAITQATSGKVDTTAITTSVTSASTDSQIPTAKAVFDVIPTGGTGGMDDDMEKLISSSLNDLNDRKIDAAEVMAKYQRKGDYATNTALALKANSADVMTLTKSEENEFVAASALVDLNNKFGGLSLVKITESDYAALTTKDDNTLYIVVADPT